MKYVLIGGDQRFEYLERILKKRGNTHWIHTKTAQPEDFAVLSSAENIIMNYPLKGDFGALTFDKILDLAPSTAQIYLCGPGKIASKSTGIRECNVVIPEDMDDNRDKLSRMVDLRTDETLIREGAVNNRDELPKMVDLWTDETLIPEGAVDNRDELTQIVDLRTDEILIPEDAADNRDELPQMVDLWTDETLILENAILTAEGAISAAMQASARSLRDCACLVIGWGRIGRAITEMLVGLGVKVTVASHSQSARNRAIERGALAVNTDRLRLKGFDVVFSTPPNLVLDEKILQKADKDVMIMDLASAPYGVDLKAAWDLGLRAWREPGLPGRYCPESAAMAIMHAIDRSKGGSV